MSATSRWSTNESAAQITQSAAGAPNGKRLRASSVRMVIATIGAASHVAMSGSFAGSSLSATSSAPATAPRTISRSNPCLRRSGGRGLTA